MMLDHYEDDDMEKTLFQLIAAQCYIRLENRKEAENMLDTVAYKDKYAFIITRIEILFDLTFNNLTNAQEIEDKIMSMRDGTIEQSTQKVDSERYMFILQVKLGKSPDVHGTETEVYSRIVGYYRAVRNWNRGKRDEFKLRKMFSAEGGFSPEKNIKTEKCQTPQGVGIHKKESDAKKDAALGIPVKNNGYYEIYTRKTCPNCPPVWNFMNKSKLAGKSGPWI